MIQEIERFCSKLDAEVMLHTEFATDGGVGLGRWEAAQEVPGRVSLYPRSRLKCREIELLPSGNAAPMDIEGHPRDQVGAGVLLGSVRGYICTSVDIDWRRASRKCSKIERPST